MSSSSSCGRDAAAGVSWIRAWTTFVALSLLAHLARAVTFDPVPPPELDLSKLGRVGLVGDFDAISLYRYREQSQNGFSTNGSQSILTSLPTGPYATLASSDAHINAMCPFVMRGGTLAGVVVGGNFTSLGGVEAQGVAMFNATSGQVTPLPGLSGKVNALLCDEPTNSVYVGGEFRGANSTNAIAWIGLDGWTNLPFAGFNGPVNTIVKASNGKIIFGGAFDGLGNKSTGPAKKHQQVVNLDTATISAGSSTARDGLADPRNIVCQSDPSDGPDSTWLLSDDTPGYWRAEFRFGFRPTKLRIWNTRFEDRGTRTFRFTALPINGIMNLTYTEPGADSNTTCDARCPLSADPDAAFQDFAFVDVIGMSSFQIDVSEWYGEGGGLNGIQLFQDDIYAFAENDFNEPSCAGLDSPSTASSTGPWRLSSSAQSSSDYLSGTFSGADLGPSTSVRFVPDLPESGNYSITVFTPGCIQDDTCSSRGRVNITGTVATGTRSVRPIQTEIFQTNNFDKYDEVYKGYVDAGGRGRGGAGDFRPSITLTPSADQEGDVAIVAQRVRFELIESTSGLNGLYEFDPDRADAAEADVTNSTYGRAGLELDDGAIVNSIVVDGDVTYVGGDFVSDRDHANIFVVRDDDDDDDDDDNDNDDDDNDNDATALPGGGLDGEVLAMHVHDGLLYVGGNFTDTNQTETDGLVNVAAFSTADEAWRPLGAGVNGRVERIVPLTLNVTSDEPETVISLTGTFDELLPFDGNEGVLVTGFAVWVPSRENWLQNLDLDIVAIDGQLTTFAVVPEGPTLVAGTLSSQGLAARGAVGLPVSGPLRLRRMPIRIRPGSPVSQSRKRAVGGQDVTGVVAGYFYENDGRNVTVLGGHFTARAADGSSVDNLALVNGSNENAVGGLGPGLSPDSTFLALAVQQDTLYAGGTVTGTVNGDDEVNGLIMYDLVRADFVQPQPPALAGDDVAVHAIAGQPDSDDVYVGGNFDAAGSMSCPSLCVFSQSASQWNRPGDGLTGSVGAMAWAGVNKLVVGGNLTVNGSATSMVTYDPGSRVWSAFAGNGQDIPGPVTALSAADNSASRFWIAGASTNGSAFLMVYDGATFRSVGDTLGTTTRIRGLQVLPLSQPHESTELLDDDQILLVSGQLDIPGFGNASAALFNGTNFAPFILSTSANSSPGSVSQIVSLRDDFFTTSGGRLAVGFVVLIALAIALALIFFLVVMGIVIERIRRKREGYLPAPTQMYDKGGNVDRIPPAYLFGTLGREGRGPGGAPMI